MSDHTHRRVLLDENVPHRLRFHLVGFGFEVMTVAYAGLTSFKNGRLLKAAEGNFDVLVTLDKSIEYQNNFTGRKLSVLVVRSPRIAIKYILPHVNDIVRAIKVILPGEVIYVGHGITFDHVARSAVARSAKE